MNREAARNKLLTHSGILNLALTGADFIFRFMRAEEMLLEYICTRAIYIFKETHSRLFLFDLQISVKVCARARVRESEGEREGARKYGQWGSLSATKNKKLLVYSMRLMPFLCVYITPGFQAAS